MTAMTYTAARENLATTMDKVCNDREPVIITRGRNQSVVMISLDDYEEIDATFHLLKSPANKKRLLSAMSSVKKGMAKPRKINLDE